MYLPFEICTLFILMSLRLPSTSVYASVPLISEGPSNQKVEEDDRVTFTCLMSDSQTTTISWYKDQRLISDRKRRFTILYFSGGSVLRIESVRSRDAGQYTCQATEESVGILESASALLTVYTSGEAPFGFPQIVENPRLKAVERGRPTVLNCAATGTPTPTITWLKDSIPIRLDDRISIINDGSLLIEDSREDDEGTYECVAENSVGTSLSYAANLYVRVRRIPPYFENIPDAEIYVSPGASIFLTCAAGGNPVPYISWYKNHSRVTSAEPGQHELSVEDIQEPAVYTCRAESTLAYIEYSTEIFIVDPKKE